MAEIDTSIYRQPQQPSLLEQMSQMLQMKTMLGQQAAQAQQQELGGLQIQQHQRDMAEEQAYRTVLAKYGGNLEAALPDLYQNAPKQAFVVAQHLQAKKAAELTQQKARLDIEGSQHKRMGALAQAGAGSPEAALAAIQQMAREGLINQEDALSAYTTPPGLLLEKMKQLSEQSMTAAEQKAEVRAALEAGYKSLEEYRKAQKFPSELAKSQNEAVTSAPNEMGLTKFQSATLAQQAKPNTAPEFAAIANDPTKTPEERAAANASLKALERHAILSRPVTNNFIQQAPLTGDTEEEKMKGVPAGERRTVQAILEGSSPLPVSRSKDANAYPNQLRRWVLDLDPNWSPQRYELYKTYNDPNSKMGQTLQSANTLLGHIGTLKALAAALNNGDTPAINAMVNSIRAQFGDAKITNAQTALQAVADESERLYVGGVGSEAGRQEFKHLLDAVRQSPAQAEGQLHTAAKLIGSRVKGARLPYDRINPKYGAKVRFLGPEARATLADLGMDPDEVEMGSGHGGAAAAPAASGGTTGRIVQHSPSTGKYRHSDDGGATWKDGQ